MKSKLYLLFALMSVTAVFASPALAAPPVPTITSPTTGTVVGATVLINISTDVASDSVEVRGLGGVLLGTAEPTDASNTSFLLAADLSDAADTPNYSITAFATNADGQGVPATVMVELDAVPAPDAPFWLSPNESGMPLYGETTLRTTTAAGIDSVEYFFDGYPIGAGVDTSEGGSATWDFPLNLDVRPLGNHTITAVAHKGAESSTESATTITIVDGTMPQINEIFPADQTVVSGTVQLVASITDDRGVQSAEYSIDDQETWHPLLQNGMIWQAPLDTTQLPNGQFVVYVRAHDNNINGFVADAGVVLDVRNNIAPVLNLDDVMFFGPLMVDGPGIYAEGATATGFPEPEISYGWFVCETPVAHCTFHDTLFYTPTAAELGYTVRLVVRATNAASSVSGNILVGTVRAAEQPPVDPPAFTPEAAPVPLSVVIPQVTTPPVTVTPVKTPEVVVVEKKIDAADTKVERAVAENKAAEKQAAKAKAEVNEAKDELAAKQAALAKAAAKANQLKLALKSAGIRADGKLKQTAGDAARELALAEKAVADAERKLAGAAKMAAANEKKAAAAEKNVAASKKTLDKSLDELAATTNQQPVVVKAEHKVETAQARVATEVARQQAADQKLAKAKTVVEETKAAITKVKTEVTETKAEVKAIQADVKQTKAEAEAAAEKLAAKQEAADRAKAKADQAAAKLKEAATAKAKAEAKQAADKAAADLAAKLKTEAEAKAAKSKVTGEAHQAELELKSAAAAAKAAGAKAKVAEANAKIAEANAKIAEAKAAAQKNNVKESKTELSNSQKALGKLKTP